MSYFLTVLCRSDRRLSSRAISEFVEEGVYFDPPPRLRSVPSSDVEGGCDSIEIKYQRKKRPIIISASVGDSIAEELEEIAEIARDAKCSKKLLDHIAQTRQVFAVEIDQHHLTDDAWAFCDCFQAYVASELDGVVYAPDDGFYDAKLQLIQRV